MSHPPHNAGPLHLDRRSLLKQGATVGAVSLAAPIAFDSFFSPAAAASADAITPILLASYTNPTDNQGGTTTPYVVPTATATAGSLIIVTFNVWWNPASTTSVMNTATVTSPQFQGGSATSIGPTTGTSAGFRYHTIATQRGYYLLAFSAVATGAPGPVTISAYRSATPTTGRISNIAAQVIELAGPATPTVADPLDAASGSGPTATVQLSPAPPADDGQLLIVAGHPNDVATGDWSEPAEFPPGSEIGDTFSNDGLQDVSLATFWEPDAESDPVSSTFTGANALARWGAFTAQISV